MRSQAAVLWGAGEKWNVEKVDVLGPHLNEVLVKVVANRLCHSDGGVVLHDH